MLVKICISGTELCRVEDVVRHRPAKVRTLPVPGDTEETSEAQFPRSAQRACEQAVFACELAVHTTFTLSSWYLYII